MKRFPSGVCDVGWEKAETRDREKNENSLLVKATLNKYSAKSTHMFAS